MLRHNHQVYPLMLWSTLLGLSAGLTAGGEPPQYLALGDSYTIGEAVPAEARWPVQLVEALAQQGIRLAPPRIIATTGWTTDELSAAMDAAELQVCYPLVSLLIGVNNQYRGRDVASYRSEFQALLDRSIALAGGQTGRVFVLSIPDWGYTPFAERSGRDLAQISAEIDAYNAAAREISDGRGVAYFDITPISRQARDEPQLVADDGLHPSGLMYRRWVEQITAPVAALIKAHPSACKAS